jgi:DNA-binding CsgD family transcriptional regulator
MVVVVFSQDAVIGEAFACLIRGLTPATVLVAGTKFEMIEGQISGRQPDLLVFTEEFASDSFRERVEMLRTASRIPTALIGRAEHAQLRMSCFDFILNRDEGTVRFVKTFRSVLEMLSLTVIDQHATISPSIGGPMSRTRSVREREVAALLLRGLRNKEIAAELGVSVPTVKLYVGKLLKIYGCTDRTQLAMALVDQQRADRRLGSNTNSAQ